MKNIDVAYLAKLAHIAISDNELSKFQKDIEERLKNFDNLPEFNDVLIEIDASNPIRLREDAVAPSLSQTDALANAPVTSGGCIVIPKTVE